MKKIYLLNIEASIAFWAKALLFFIFFSFSVSALAHPLMDAPDDTGTNVSESKKDSISQNPDNGKVTKIYVSEGTTFFNIQEINDNVKIIQQAKSAVAKKQKIGLSFSKKTSKPHPSKTKTEEEKYASEIQIKQLPLGSNGVFSRSGGNVITVPTTNPQPKMQALLVQYHVYFHILAQEKHVSKYVMSFTNETVHWQMRIRPPPAI